MTEDEMVGWHHQLNGHEFEQAPGVGDGQGGLACCSPWDCKESDVTEQLNGTAEQEVSGWQASEASSVFTAAVHHSHYRLSSASCQLNGSIKSSQEHEPYCDLHK